MESYKQVIVVRGDLELSPGKLSAQVSHAAVTASHRADPDVYDAWDEKGHIKIVLEAPDADALGDLAEQADAAGLPHSLVADMGRTEIPSGTRTALAIGPAEESEVDKITGSLPLHN